MSDQDDLLLQLTSTLEQLEAAPNNVQLILSQITLMTSLGMASEVLDATLRLAALVMLHERELPRVTR